MADLMASHGVEMLGMMMDSFLVGRWVERWVVKWADHLADSKVGKLVVMLVVVMVVALDGWWAALSVLLMAVVMVSLKEVSTDGAMDVMMAALKAVRLG